MNYILKASVKFRIMHQLNLELFSGIVLNNFINVLNSLKVYYIFNIF